MSVLAFFGALFIRALHATLRVRHVRRDRIESLPQYIISFWHAHLLLMLHSAYRKPVTVMISRSKDGEIISSVFRWYGVRTARGSSTRGGREALRQLIREAREGTNIVFTPDGPKGPARILKDGIVSAARVTGLPIVPIAFAAKKKDSSARGIEWSSRGPSQKRCSSTASRSSFRAMATRKCGARRSNAA